jgi:hypothetical protein
MRPPVTATRPAGSVAASAGPASAPAAAPPVVAAPPPPGAALPADAHDRYFGALKAGKRFFYNAVIEQAHRIAIAPGRIEIAFAASRKVPRSQCEKEKAYLEELSEKVLGQRLALFVTVANGDDAAAPPPVPAAPPPATTPPGPPGAPAAEDVKQQALSNPAVKDLFEIFPVERTQVEEM